MSIRAIILPGDGTAFKPAFNRVKVRTPLAPPAMTAKIE